MKTKELVARVRTPFLFYLFIGLGPIVAALVAAMSNTPIRSAMEAAVPLLLRYLAYFIAPPLAIAVLCRLVGRRYEVATLLLLGLVSALVAFAGAGQVAAAAVLLAVSMVIGGLLVGKPDSTDQKAVPVSTTMLAGLAMTVGAIGWLLPLKIHHGPAYVAASLLVLYFGRRRIDSMSRLAATQWGVLSRAHPWSLSFAVASAGLASLFLWLPSLNYDDNSGHLILAKQLLASGYYRMDVSSNVLAVVPWFNNALHAVLAMLSGDEARPAVGLLWLLFGCTGAYRFARSLNASSPAASLAAALYASHPLTAYFGTTLQVDGASAACLLHLLATTLDTLRVETRGSPALFGALFGVLAALKITNLVYIAPIAIVLVYYWIKQRNFRAVLMTAGLAVMVSGSSYVYAQLITGNPLFPFYNGIFGSPYIPPVNFSDTRWQSGVSVLSPLNITFSTNKFMEAYPGAAGIALVALAGGALLALFERGRGAALVLGCLIVGTVVFTQSQYLRYIFPAIAVLSTVAAVALFRRLGPRWGFAAVAVVALAQFALLRTTSWMFNDGAVNHLLANGPGGRRDLERKYVPERLLVPRLASKGEPFCLLFAAPDAPYVALAASNAVSMAWYDTRMSVASTWADEDYTGHRWQRVLSSIGISHVATRSPLAKPALQHALNALGFHIVDRIGEAVLWQRSVVNPHNCVTGFLGRRDEAVRLLTVDKD